MPDIERPERLEMRWLPVESGGRVRMEAVWVTVGTAAPLVASHAA